MLSPEQKSEVLPKLITILIIHCALVMGVVMFAVVMSFITDWSKLSNEAGMLSLMAAITGLMTYGMSFIVPKLLRASPATIAANLVKRKQTKDVADQAILEALVNNHMSSRIVAAALLEGGLFLNLIMFLIEPNTVLIAMVIIGLALLLLRTPLIGIQLNTLEMERDEVKRELQLLR